MKMGGADYSTAELPEGVADHLTCIRCNGPMSHIGRGLFVCFECRMIGTEMTPTEELPTRPLPKFEDSVKTLVRSARPSLAPLVPLSFDRPQDVEPILTDETNDTNCGPSMHQWSRPTVGVVTVEETSVRCNGCGTVLKTRVQGTPQQVMADLLRQIPK